MHFNCAWRKFKTQLKTHPNSNGPITGNSIPINPACNEAFLYEAIVNPTTTVYEPVPLLPKRKQIEPLYPALTCSLFRLVWYPKLPCVATACYYSSLTEHIFCNFLIVLPLLSECGSVHVFMLLGIRSLTYFWEISASVHVFMHAMQFLSDTSTSPCTHNSARFTLADSGLIHEGPYVILGLNFGSNYPLARVRFYWAPWRSSAKILASSHVLH